MSPRLLALLLALAPLAPMASAAGSRSGKAAKATSGSPGVEPLGGSLQSVGASVLATLTPTLTGTLSPPSLSPVPGLAAPIPALPLSAPSISDLSPAAAPMLPAAPPAQPSETQDPVSAPPAAPEVRKDSLLERARNWLFPPQLSGSYSLGSADAFFHGTSLARIEEAAETGGVLSAQRTYLSDEPGFSHGYARASARRTGTPGVVLQFSADAVAGKLAAGHYSPVVQAGHGMPTQLARFSMALGDIPLSGLTPASKEALLAHYALARDLAPGDAAAASKLASVARALGAAVPAPRPLRGLADLEPGHRVLIPEGSSGREALYAGLSDGKVILVEARGGAWLKPRRVEAEGFKAVVDIGPAPAETLAAVGKLHKIDWSGGSQAERLDLRFAARGLWAKVAPDAAAEIIGLRARKLSKAALKAYVRAEVEAAFERVKAARGVGNIGLHFNLHGGTRRGYVGAGIRASKGDIALRHSTHGDPNDKVYFFQTAAHSPYEALDASNGEILLLPSRMGSVLNVFDLDAPELASARADGRIRGSSAISMDFHGMPGVPYSAYLAPPMTVFTATAKRLGLRSLSRDEETLATARFLEAALTEGGADIPGKAAASGSAAARGAAARAAAAADAEPDIPPRFKLVDNDYYYHGTTLADLERVVESGGEMAPEVSMYSQRAGDSVGYAAERKRKLGRPDNPAVLLQFGFRDLSPLVSGKAFAPALAMTDRGMPPVHAAYVAAEKPVPLALMTAQSKESILVWLRAKAARRPDEPRWARLAERLEAALHR
ncbi:MAG: hypothetical protein HY927_09245 [Elusimicrobia bacterium]|nr:hypothetical protein [Elusimicrobiota bacterium]